MKENKQNFNGGYIGASQEAYDLLVKEYVPQKGITQNMIHGYLRVSNGMIIDESLQHSVFLELKQFYINNGALSWDEPTFNGFTSSEKIEIMKKMQGHKIKTISIKDEDRNELLSIVKYMANSFYSEVKDFEPLDTTNGLISQISNMVMDLQRKPKWYEDEANFPALIYTSEGFYVAKKKMEASYVFNGTDRLATKAERDSLYCEG